eukprot:2332070-Pyramimonas_sp.AAC.1
MALDDPVNKGGHHASLVDPKDFPDGSLMAFTPACLRKVDGDRKLPMLSECLVWPTDLTRVETNRCQRAMLDRSLEAVGCTYVVIIDESPSQL